MHPHGARGEDGDLVASPVFFATHPFQLFMVFDDLVMVFGKR